MGWRCHPNPCPHHAWQRQLLVVKRVGPAGQGQTPLEVSSSKRGQPSWTDTYALANTLITPTLPPIIKTMLGSFE